MESRCDDESTIIASLFAIGMALVAFLLTSFVNNQPHLLILKTMGIALLLINISSSPRVVKTNRVIFCDLGVLIVLLVLLLTFADGKISELWSTSLAVTGTTSFIVVLMRNVAAQPLKTVRITIWSIGYIFVAGQMVWHGGYRNPLYLLGLLTRGEIPRDPVFHQTLIAMLKTYGICSTGLNGPVEMSYHYFAHLIASRLGFLLGATPDLLVHLVMPLMFSGLIILWALRSVSVLGKLINGPLSCQKNSNWKHITFLAGLGLPQTSFLLDGTLWDFNFSSDSQVVGLLVCMVVLCSAIEVVRVRNECQQKSSSKLNVPALSVLVLATVTAVGVLAFSKISVAHLFVVGLIYLMWRVDWHWQIRSLLAAVSIITVYLASTGTNSSTIGLYFSPFALWWYRMPLSAWPVCVPITLSFVITYMVIRLKNQRIAALYEVADLIRRRRILDVEVLFCVSLAAAGVTATFGGHLAFNSMYYVATAQFFALVAVAACPYYEVGSLSLSGVRRISVCGGIALLMLGLCFLSAVANSGEKWRNVIRLNLQCRGDSVAVPLGMASDSEKLELRVLLRAFRFAEFASAVRRNTAEAEKLLFEEKNKTLWSLLQIGQLLTSEQKKEALLWVPRVNDRFWSFANQESRWQVPMLAASLTEMALIDGLAMEKMSPGGGGFGFSAYPAPSDWGSPMQSLKEVMIAARKMGFTTVVELKMDGSFELHATDVSPKR
jgi:hypothetical protein